MGDLLCLHLIRVEYFSYLRSSNYGAEPNVLLERLPSSCKSRADPFAGHTWFADDTLTDDVMTP